MYIFYFSEEVEVPNYCKVEPVINIRMLFRNIDNYFLVMLRGKGPAQTRGKLYLAVDDLTVREGQCDD